MSLSPTLASPARTLQCLEVWGGNQAVDKALVLPGLDAWVLSRPYGGAQAGGDLHYLSSCATGRITRLLLADVSGHGDPVAGLAGELRALMRRYVNYLDQRSLVEKLNRAFGGLADPTTFATAVVATYWAPTDSLVVSSAGHPPPFWYQARRSRWRVLKPRSTGRSEAASNTPLGIDETGRYDQLALTLAPGDLFLFYTDSLIEAADPAGRQLGEAGLLAILRRLGTAEPRRLVAEVLEAVDAHRGGSPAADDATLVLLRQNDLKPRPSLAAALASTGRLLRALLSPLFRGGPIPWPEARLENLAGPFWSRLNRRWSPGRPLDVGDERGSDEGKTGLY